MPLRLLVILVLLASGLPGLGVVRAGDQSHHSSCDDAGCHPVAVRTTCCGETIEDAYCSMSGGKCRCAAAPAPTDQPQPPAPMPRPDRDSLTAIPHTPTTIALVADDESLTSDGLAQSLGLLAGLTHNEIQALLGIWRT